MKFFVRIVFFLIAIISIVSISCKPSSSSKSTEDKGDLLSKEQIQESIEKVVFPLPDPMGVYQMLEDIGANYVGSVLNPVSSADNYFQNSVKAVNLGVYAADLSYSTVYDKKDDIDAYTQSLKKLVDDLGIQVDYRKLTSDDTKEMILTSDSLIKVTTNIFYDTYEFLYVESDPALAVLMVNGFYIEGLYIATHISEDTYNNTEMVEIIYGQAEPLKELIKLNEKFLDNQYVQSIQGALIKLKEMYDATNGTLTEQQLKSISDTIQSIRDSQVS